MKKFAFMALAALVVSPTVMPEAASAQYHRHYDRTYRDRTYNDRDGRYRHRCSGGDGATGTIAGGVGGAVLGNVLGGGTLGTIAGGVGGGLLGRHLDKQHTRNRRGC
jgi:outer membrane lipoprotein SlyB